MSRKIRAKNFIRDWVLPPKLFRCLLRVVGNEFYRVTDKDKKILKRNSIFKDKYHGKRCFVIGNGPSLNAIDLSKLNGEIAIVMNHFDRHPILKTWQPSLYCLGDSPTTITANDRESLKDKGNYIFPEAFFFSLKMKPIIDSFNEFPKDKAYYLDMREDLEDWNLNHYEIDLTKKTTMVRTTAMLAIILAIYAGCNKIYLLGIDFSWLAYPKFSLTSHFYHNTNVDDEDNYENAWNYRQNIEAVLGQYRQYEKIHQYAKKRGIEIINLTENSFLDEFPRAKFEDVL